MSTLGSVTGVVDVVLPVLDEAAAIPVVLASLPPGFEPVVVDNGSSDGSVDIARAAGARVVQEPRRGFGAACFAGLMAATTEVVCFMDCDASFDGRDLEMVAAPVLAHRADLVLGSRQAEPGAWPLHARLANRFLARRVGRRTGLSLTDLGPIRAARRIPLIQLGLQDRRSGWPLEMVLRAADDRWRIEEVPVAYRPRVGKSKVTGTVMGTTRAVLDMARVLR